MAYTGSDRRRRERVEIADTTRRLPVAELCIIGIVMVLVWLNVLRFF